MSDLIVRVDNNSLLPSDDLVELNQKATTYIESSKAKNTNIAYKSDWDNFVLWCQSNSLQFMPASDTTIQLYITKLAVTKKTSTIRRRLTSIRLAHQLAKQPDPTKSGLVKMTMDGISRENGTKQIGKRAILTDDILKIIPLLPEGSIGVRDKAILLIGFAGAFRRSELVAMKAEDLRFDRRTLYITIQKSKTDQTGEGEVIAINLGENADTCPIQALEDWLSLSGITEGYLFRRIRKNGKILDEPLGAHWVARIVKKYARLLKMDPHEFGGHSLRSGFVTQTAINGATYDDIMKTTRHKKYDTVRKYMRDIELKNNASSKLGL
ncbi:site-specific integrase [Alicyclobacillus fodiniaquatilis]|uniref:Site-specific integrase n=1 Tax=Alicyclobacillus fodiniaquatilis TaxID=1661150 RepID=A0ABW4JJB1_9BACL